MTSKVFFADLRARGKEDNRRNKLRRLFEAAGFSDLISDGDLTAIKIHFGEMGNDGFIRPIYVRPIVDAIRKSGGNPFLTDANTLYHGTRANSVDHLNTAIANGFAYEVIGAPLIICDGIRSKSYREIPIDGKHFKKLRMSNGILDSDSMIVMSHFKGHETAGFGGAIKNLGMGCAPALGKMDQHSLRPKVTTVNCVGCGKCTQICPADAISFSSGKASIGVKCIGCGECITICPEKAIVVDWEIELPVFTERMVEYTLGAVHGKEGKLGYINFLVNITPHCDCFNWSDAPIVKDIGILASKDPVAIDKASWDLINQQVGIEDSLLKDGKEAGGDKIKGLWENTYPDLQISYAKELGLGTDEYELIKL